MLEHYTCLQVVSKRMVLFVARIWLPLVSDHLTGQNPDWFLSQTVTISETSRQATTKPDVKGDRLREDPLYQLLIDSICLESHV